VRACIGRAFAWQELLLTVATLLQTFHFAKAHPSYQLQVKWTLTIKPENFYIKARLRDKDFLKHAGSLIGGEPGKQQRAPETKKRGAAVTKADLKPIRVCFGSNTGTCEGLANALASAAPAFGYSAEVTSLDEAVSTLKEDLPTVVITASYEGHPPDNAGHFVEWLTSGAGESVKDLEFAVFGLGNSEYPQTALPINVSQHFVRDAIVCCLASVGRQRHLIPLLTLFAHRGVVCDLPESPHLDR
jgi:cytochrome P450/NADPH-cytochrome P450 reductase